MKRSDLEIEFMERFDLLNDSLSGGDIQVIDFTEEMMRKHGVEMKIKGARSFAKLVGKMRQAQKDYFSHRSKDHLKRSKELENQVDRALELILTNP